jgi:head-tail adaptor
MRISNRFLTSTVKIESCSDTTSTGVDSYGTYSKTWSTYIASLPCYIRWLSGHERLYLDKSTYVRDAIVYCDYGSTNAAINPGNYRLEYDSKTYNIVDVKNTGEQNQHIAISIKREE